MQVVNVTAAAIAASNNNNNNNARELLKDVEKRIKTLSRKVSACEVDVVVICFDLWVANAYSNVTFAVLCIMCGFSALFGACFTMYILFVFHSPGFFLRTECCVTVCIEHFVALICTHVQMTKQHKRSLPHTSTHRFPHTYIVAMYVIFASCGAPRTQQADTEAAMQHHIALGEECASAAHIQCENMEERCKQLQERLQQESDTTANALIRATRSVSHLQSLRDAHQSIDTLVKLREFRCVYTCVCVCVWCVFVFINTVD